MNKAAQALGRLGKGKAKTLTPAERQRRREWMTRFNATRAERIAAKVLAVTTKAAPMFAGCFIGSLAALVLAWLIRGMH